MTACGGSKSRRWAFGQTVCARGLLALGPSGLPVGRGGSRPILGLGLVPLLPVCASAKSRLGCEDSSLDTNCLTSTLISPL